VVKFSYSCTSRRTTR